MVDPVVGDERTSAQSAKRTDRELVEELLGRPPKGDFEVVVRDIDGRPVVIKNEPLLPDGRPMPTLYWLVGSDIRSAIGTIESSGGVRAAEAAIGLEAIAVAHDQYARERDSLIADNHVGHRPSGGVGGTRRGVKCLHAHYAWYLAGGPDPVGRWVHEKLQESVERK